MLNKWSFLLKCFIIVSFTFIGYYSFIENPYIHYKDYNVEVVEKYSGEGHGKYSKLQFIIVYKTDKGIIFDENVSAGTYYQLHKGDTLTLERRPFDVKQTSRENTLLVVRLLVGIISVLVLAFVLSFTFSELYTYFKGVFNDSVK